MKRNENHPDKQESPGFLVFMNALNGVTQFLLGAVALSGFSYGAAYRKSLSIGSIVVVSWFSSYAQHIFLCVTGYVILMCQAILVFNPYAGWATNLQHSHKKVVHIAMQIGGSLLAIVGTVIKMMDRNANFSSAHAYFGFFAMLLTMLNLIGGVLNFKFSQHNERLSVIKLMHTSLGCLTVTFAFIAMIIAYANHDDRVCVAFTVLALIGILASVVVLHKVLKMPHGTRSFDLDSKMLHQYVGSSFYPKYLPLHVTKSVIN